MNDWIDLRSDTVTRPTEEMRAAMSTAAVGDDVYGEDPTVNALEEQLAGRLGMAAGLFVASGTQSNLIALLTHCQRGDEYIVGDTAHAYRFEGGGAAALGGIQPQPLPFLPDGTLDLAEVSRLVKPDDVHFARTRLLCLENTKDGIASGSDYYEKAGAMAGEHGLAVHLDGARFFNAVVELGCEPTEITRHCDSVSICLSKGLGAPVGSVLLGSEAFIRAARRWRKVVGGGMRQAGILAAAGIYALDNNVERLRSDHRHAAEVARALGDHVQLPVQQHTNMLFLDLSGTQLHRLREHLSGWNIRINRNRWVFHLDITEAAVDRIITAIRAYGSS